MTKVHNVTTVKNPVIDPELKSTLKKVAISIGVQIVVITVISVAADQLSKAVIAKIES
jgi:hypothetical protein